MDSQGRVVSWNERATAMLGWPRQEAIGRTVAELLIPPRFHAAHQQGLARFLATGEGSVLDRRVELSAVRRDGSEFPVELTVTALEEGGELFFNAFVEDITERKQAAEAENRARESEEQARLAFEANRLKSEFLANMSHELRTPLNAILGFSELLQDGGAGPMTSSQEEYLGDIVKSSRYLLQLINDLLDLARIEAGKVKFQPEPVHLATTVMEAQFNLRALAERKRIRFETDADPALGLVLLDPHRLRQVLFNYLSNALKFTPDGGCVTVRIRAEGERYFRLAVEDTGLGISAEELGLLFREFHQLEAGAARTHAGTGLGLALTKRLVEAQGGWVGAESTPGKGSVFFAVLPRAAVAP
jgi:PAS domain S-box-containing protein